jgi:hypothetical protein
MANYYKPNPHNYQGKKKNRFETQVPKSMSKKKAMMSEDVGTHPMCP